MSGICGIIHFDGEPVDPAQLAQMAQAMAYRGPDGIRYHVDGGVGMAHLALHTTPESVWEIQPLFDPASGCVLTAKARIDNRPELIPYLRSKGWLQMAQISDVDVILAAYLEWGRDCPVHLLGDFVFVLWDPRTRSVLAARDPLGQNVLHYYPGSGGFRWASEAFTLFADGSLPRQINELAIAAYLDRSYALAEDLSYYQGVRVLQPAESLWITRDALERRRYWDFDPEARLQYARSEEYAEHFRELFLRAVQDRLRSLRPLGVLLSGGLDSASVAGAAAYLRQQTKSPVPTLDTVTWYAPGADTDERPRSRPLVAQWQFTNLELDVTPYWPMYNLPDWAPLPDSPLESWLYGFLEQTLQTRTEPRVWLGGHLGDNVIGMINWHYYVERLARGQIVSTLREMDAHRRMYRLSWKLLLYMLAPVVYNLPQLAMARKVVQGLRRQSDRQVLSPDFRERAGRLQAEQAENQPVAWFMHDPAITGSPWQRRYYLLRSYSFDEFQYWYDNRSARHGSEVWLPWADVRLASFVLAIPAEITAQGLNHKRLPRQALKDIVAPGTLEWRGRRSGAPVYAANSMHSAAFRERAAQLLAGGRLRQSGWLAAGRLASGAAPAWKWLTLERWLQQYW